jgi:uncharacterized protein YfaS (alpha-2-macroglobulin family)
MIADWRRMADTLCLDGMSTAETTPRRFSPACRLHGRRLRETFRTRVVVPDRKPQQRFSGTGYVPPKPGTAGLPLITINVDKVELRLLRVNERNLVPSIDAERLTMSFSSYAVDEIINRSPTWLRSPLSRRRKWPAIDASPPCIAGSSSAAQHFRAFPKIRRCRGSR